MAFLPLDQEKVYLSTTALGKWKIVYENEFFNSGRCITGNYVLLVLLYRRCRAYIFPIVKNVPIDVSAHAR